MSKSSTSFELTVYHDGQFWVGIIEQTETGRLSACRIVFGAEPSNEEIIEFLSKHWNNLRFSPSVAVKNKHESTNPKRRQREAAKQAAQARPSTKAQEALAEMREQGKEANRKKRASAKKELSDTHYQQKKEKRKQKHRGR